MAVFGAGGFGKEVKALLDVLAARDGQVQFAGFLDDQVRREPMAVEGTFDDVVLAMARPSSRLNVLQRMGPKKFPFQCIVHPDVEREPTNKIGRGSILCSGVRMTVDVRVGEFVIVNLNCTIGHDVVIGDFSSVMPSVNLSGGVTVGKNVFIGSGATILQGLVLGDNAVVGAGSVVTRSVGPGKTVMGIPAREK